MQQHETSPVYRDKNYIYAICYDADTNAYGISMSGLDSTKLYEDHAVYPIGWTTLRNANLGIRDMAFHNGLIRLNKNGRVVLMENKRKKVG